MLDWSTRGCAICGGTLQQELLRVLEPDRFERHVGIGREGYQRSWVECERCGAVTNVQEPENVARLNAIAAGYYEVDLAGSSVAEKYAKVMGLPPERSDNAQRVARIRAFLSGRGIRGGRALDIGAGTGVFLSRFLQEAGEAWQGFAVEPDPVAAAHLQSLGKFMVIRDLFHPRLGLDGFNLVTLNKVVEHLSSPVALVRDAATALARRDGVLYIELPDKATIRERPPSDNILGALHCHLYDTLSVKVLVKAAGLSLLDVDRVLEPSGKISVFAFAQAAATTP
jgi:SAM-dependent methyltransferase